MCKGAEASKRQNCYPLSYDSRGGGSEHVGFTISRPWALLCWVGKGFLCAGEDLRRYIRLRRKGILLLLQSFVLFCFHSKQPNDYVSLGLLSGRKSKKVNAWEWVLKEKGKQNEKLGNAEELFCHLNKFA